MAWIVSLEPIESRDVCKIEIENNFNVIVLDDVTFGDVWFCSGQSNMGWAMLGKFSMNTNASLILCTPISLFLKM